MRDSELIGKIARLREIRTQEQNKLNKQEYLSYQFYDGYLQALQEIRKYILNRQL